MDYFKDYVAKLKAKAEAEKEKAAIALQKQGLAQNNAGQNNVGGFKPSGSTPVGSSFYFYNDQTVAYGKNEFTRIWGDRENRDNWRWSNRRGATQGIENALAENDLAEDNEFFDAGYYIAQIPSEKKTIDSIAKERNFAYFQLGLIYKEKFKEYELSKTKFISLLDNEPEDRLILPSKYNLFKIYEILGLTTEMERVKNEITTNYPRDPLCPNIKSS
ncbi:hypothetical protein N7U66_13135 [Lacinutrix neustonica]|uniref:Uncharacterized protein n=1 Tax=Lacinutrix neustonica TaxID=2980107 RepID=A0A9E8MTM2_9FLAO|nr:hypothetical protein [Lacinutrix neustonica]WAC01106.1 hypothetical protein N7U66_13135 [Lacinutrix neustonica]